MVVTILPTDIFITTYLGHDIYRREPPYAPKTVHVSEYIGMYFRLSAMKKRTCLYKGGTWDGTSCSIGPEDVPVSDIWVNHSTYQGITIESMYDAGVGRTSYRALLDNKWWSSTSLATVRGYIDTYLKPVEPPVEPPAEPPAEPTLKPTDLTISVSPRTGSPPYNTTITTELTSESDGIRLAGKRINLIKNGFFIKEGVTNSSGVIEFQDTVTDDAAYYTHFMGDSVYEGCPAPEVM